MGTIKKIATSQGYYDIESIHDEESIISINNLESNVYSITDAIKSIDKKVDAYIGKNDKIARKNKWAKHIRYGKRRY